MTLIAEWRSKGNVIRARLRRRRAIHLRFGLHLVRAVHQRKRELAWSRAASQEICVTFCTVLCNRG